ncbi:MAG: hypothetical protein FD143_1038 [Ignavibacteria bacterium]|nr:MAG: hypothetical protein FD143_1038 [Ignavibacteria bacterium]KAF0160969.1 MAG: hypothetical protein FD188_1190 [Ignavibacteria bacterium]
MKRVVDIIFLARNKINLAASECRTPALPCGSRGMKSEERRQKIFGIALFSGFN